MIFKVGESYTALSFGSRPAEERILDLLITNIDENDTISFTYKFRKQNHPSDNWSSSKNTVETMINQYLIYSSPLFEALG